ncbi:hypothetical protein [uncultured Dokdonia sp.]|uniref:hypothetical protein n=1 Tax=uncultured Dokdonia sp. TaxID=575653 RepID=UPI00261FDC4A|nr:hypothetical protein [uncultured Dokdonia sp.]
MPDILEYIEQQKVDNAILNHSFLRDQNDKVNLNHYGTGHEYVEKLKFQGRSFEILRDAGKVPNSFEAFRKMDYDDIMIMLIKRLVVKDYPEYRSVKDDPAYATELRYQNFNDNKIGYGACSPLSASPTDAFEYELPNMDDNTVCFAENYEDISLGRWIVNGIKKAVQFIQSL